MAAKAKPKPKPTAKPKAKAKAKTARAAAAKKTADPVETFELLRARHADAHCELDHRNPFELIVATVLSAQSTDVMVNKITPELFQRWPGPAQLAGANPA